MCAKEFDYVAARNQYAYPAWRLERVAASEPKNPEHLEAWGMRFLPGLLCPSLALDKFHNKLLNSHSDQDLLHGLISVVYWGYVSGRDGVSRQGRAKGKAMQLCRGRKNSIPQPREEILKLLRSVQQSVREDDLSQALLSAMQIKFLGMSFASKVIAFMTPEKAGVYDSVISECLQSRAECSDLYVSTNYTRSKARRLHQAETYARWCAFCCHQAQDLNHQGLNWHDWDGKPHRWRAIDVERAFFTGCK
ncbi:MAG: hypothetical protein PHE17_21270 [Thiothrix sp.]|uniref:8-oxoguanine DNA glycosylase OGG fold protein n=1 Tax=Thiothrix sp. TaxID=1032 RepID=UPI0026374957|nr:hypothetical protein [Thiothrix sp.]MDD5395562.1 hypothetical protein [Thiothrix sp.]